MKRLERLEPRYGQDAPQPSVAETWGELRGFSRPIQVGVHSYLDDGRPLHAAFATSLESGSFKERNGIIATRTLGERGVREVVVYSAGNHLSGTALGAPAADIMLHGFVPEYAPQEKVDLSLELGGDHVSVTRVEGGLDNARKAAYKLAEDKGIPVIEPYEGEGIARAQGTIMHELLLQQPDLEYVLVPEGGGGLEAGCIRAIREFGSRTKVVGVKLSSEKALCEGAYVSHVGKVALSERGRSPELWYGTLHVTPAHVGRMVHLEDSMRQEAEWAMGQSAWHDYPEATALLGAAAAHRYQAQLEGNIAVIVTGSNANRANLDTLHDRYLGSIPKGAMGGTQISAGYQYQQIARDVAEKQRLLANAQ